ncbi:MAG: single-stranded DNA-binding protein [Patescibacteria group bacterium]|jgi:single-strand DNA-binding protein
MSSRSVNKVILVGNLTRDPELRYTPQGTAVASFGVATNREWVSDGQKKEAADFHNVVAWNKLGELCAQLLGKGTKVYVEGRLQTRDWTNDTGEKRYKTEVVIDEMIVLSSGKFGDSSAEPAASGEAPTHDKASSNTEAEIDLDDILSDTSFDAAETPEE